MAQFDCDTPECVAALVQLQDGRNAILTLCNELKELRDKRARYLATAGAFAVFGTALAAAANKMKGDFPWGTIMAIILYIWAAAQFAIATMFVLLALALDDDIKKLEDELATARKAFDAAVANVMGACPSSECWPDLNQPSCP